jgi:hypothetical protein
MYAHGPILDLRRVAGQHVTAYARSQPNSSSSVDRPVPIGRGGLLGGPSLYQRNHNSSNNNISRGYEQERWRVVTLDSSISPNEVISWINKRSNYKYGMILSI